MSAKKELYIGQEVAVTSKHWPNGSIGTIRKITTRVHVELYVYPRSFVKFSSEEVEPVLTASEAISLVKF